EVKGLIQQSPILLERFRRRMLRYNVSKDVSDEAEESEPLRVQWIGPLFAGFSLDARKYPALEITLGENELVRCEPRARRRPVRCHAGIIARLHCARRSGRGSLYGVCVAARAPSQSTTFGEISSRAARPIIRPVWSKSVENPVARR